VSEQNVELHHQAIAAYNARDLEAIIALCDPSIELHSYLAVGSSPYHGHDGMRKWHQDAADAWGEEIHIEPEVFFDLGEQTLLFYVIHGRGRQSGVQVEMPNAQVFRWRERLLVYAKVYGHSKDALKDLGIAEDELKPIAP
jgi:hypothetical protein